ncbi:LuxR C-terminal-related transcriptional regulator [Halomonas janggokensis]|uniref:LuxR C-terminal-related transcriptional regulator n=1 Tax=Vreelandella janggokensis TaxID=370767 RepID=A0ABT4IV63_9GAMM|nr:LuxR C-terminal-related transcriptional regulator [Halomonas janggokensis]MCZ0927567.1 LuxR C-terminal-related transcriptional regulator [Halomonas janggokensis]MCZ0930075.1 LuxR C-terminal-related transcriptional regulator [Halomonas janggokensis]
MYSHQELGVNCLNAFTRAVPASLAAFYRIDDGLSAVDFQLHGDPTQMHDSYLRRYRHLDPLQPGYCQRLGRQVVPLRDAQALQSRRHNEGYQTFLSQHDVVDVTEVLFYTRDRPVMGMSLLRKSRYGRFTPRELDTLQSLQEMLQLAVSASAVEPAPAQIQDARVPLTEREAQLVPLLRQGLSNKAMARALGIAPSTIKTHLDNLYRKLEVTNRTELVGRLYP